MLYAHEPTRRAGVLASSLICLVLLAGCNNSDLTDPGAATATGDHVLLDTMRRLPSSDALIVSPNSATTRRDQSVHFVAYDRSSSGDSVAIAVDWSVSGGTISSTGDFTASSAGTYSVVGRTKGRWKRADTSTVVVAVPQLPPVGLAVSPASVTLTAGGKRTFTATELLADSSTTPAAATWTASGGSIDASGTFTAGSTPGSYWVAAVDPASGFTDSSTVVVDPSTPPAPTLQAITLSPASTSLQTGASRTFTAVGVMSDGSTAPAPVRFSATGGTITNGGVYTAGSSAGTYRVVATDTSGAVADTAAVTVTVPAPTLTAIVITPSSASLQTGATQQFSASGRMSDGSAAAVSVGYVATGGTVSGSGLYTAGQSAGGYRVIASLSGGTLADTASVTIAAPPPPPPPPPSGCTGVTIAAGASIQNAVNANGTGVTFCLSSGSYPRQTVQPKDGQRFVGARDANGARLSTLDGQGATQYAFTGSAKNVVIEGLRVCNYTPALSNGAIFLYNATGVQVLDNEICNNKPGAGTDVFTGWVIRGNWIHHNGQLGITGQAYSVGAVVDSNEISYNNEGQVTDPNCCAGGVKVVQASNLVIRGNWVHHNSGEGIWCDFCQSGTQYLGNRVEDNTFVGIYHEASDGALIDGNTVLRNGSSNRGGIWVDNSGNVEVRNNIVNGATSGIMGRQVSRSDTQRQLTNLWVHNNQVTLEGSEYTGVVQYVGDNSYFSSKGNRFTSNTYSLGGSTPFAWNNTRLSMSQWTAAGQQ